VIAEPSTTASGMTPPSTPKRWLARLATFKAPPKARPPAGRSPANCPGMGSLLLAAWNDEQLRNPDVGGDCAATSPRFFHVGGNCSVHGGVLFFPAAVSITSPLRVVVHAPPLSPARSAPGLSATSITARSTPIDTPLTVSGHVGDRGAPKAFVSRRNYFDGDTPAGPPEATSGCALAARPAP